jgi:hypothetical protein
MAITNMHSVKKASRALSDRDLKSLKLLSLGMPLLSPAGADEVICFG